jgi:hypothetical protein
MKNINNDSFPKGEYGQKVCESLFDWLIKNKKLISYDRTEHYEYEGLSYERDYEWTLNDLTKVGVEVKCIAGEWNGKPCDTLVVEHYQNFAMTKRPGWWNSVDAGELGFIFFVNRLENKIYMFNAGRLQYWINEEETKGTLKMTKCGDGNENSKGYIVKVPWESKAAGFMKVYPFKKR